MGKYNYLKYVINNGRVLRTQYRRLLYPFFNVRKIRELRDRLYELEMEEWVLDRIWEYLNGDIEIEELILIYARSIKVDDKRV